MSGIEIVAISAIVIGLFGFLSFLGFLAHTNNSKNLKNDYLVIESRCSCLTHKTSVSCEAAKVEEDSEKKDNTNISKVVRVNGIGKQICDKRK